MLSRNLEKTLRRALALANARQHEYATLEHLLMALTDDEDAAAVLKACAVEVDRLRACLNDFLDHELTSLTVEGVVDAKPTAASSDHPARGDPCREFGAERGDRRQRSGRPFLGAGVPRSSSCKSRTCRASMPSTTSATASPSGRT